MNFKLSQQVSATYARNNFKAVNEKVLKEGMCVIIKKSQPVSVILSMKEYEKFKHDKNVKAIKPRKKMTLEELRKNSHFSKFVGIFDGPEFEGKTSREILKMWTNYVD